MWVTRNTKRDVLLRVGFYFDSVILTGRGNLHTEGRNKC